MRPLRLRSRWGLLTVIASGLAWLLPAGAARAQSSYGYDSFVYGAAPAQSYYANAGYSPIYSDPSTAEHAIGEQEPFRRVVPYAAPPYGMFGPSDGLTYVYPAPANTAPARVQTQVVTPRRRGLLGRVRGRR